MTLRSKTIRLAHEKPELREHLLPILKGAAEDGRVQGGRVQISDEQILEAAAEAAKSEPKKRFSGYTVREALKAKLGLTILWMEGKSIEQRLEALARDRKIVTDRARGFYKLVKATSGQGVEFRSAGGGGFDILVNGETVGEISIEDGEFIHGSSRQREKVYHIDLDDEEGKFVGANAPPDFKKLTDAKAWVKKRLEA